MSARAEETHASAVQHKAHEYNQRQVARIKPSPGFGVVESWRSLRGNLRGARVQRGQIHRFAASNGAKCAKNLGVDLGRNPPYGTIREHGDGSGLSPLRAEATDLVEVRLACPADGRPAPLHPQP